MFYKAPKYEPSERLHKNFLDVIIAQHVNQTVRLMCLLSPSFKRAISVISYLSTVFLTQKRTLTILTLLSLFEYFVTNCSLMAQQFEQLHHHFLRGLAISADHNRRFLGAGSSKSKTKYFLEFELQHRGIALN